MASRAFSTLVQRSAATAGSSLSRPLAAFPTATMQPAAAAPAASAAARRFFGAHAKADDSHGAGEHAHESHGVEFEGLELAKPKPWQLYGAHFFGGLMWFWVLYRFKNDYKVFLGLEHPWDGHHGHDDAHAEDSHKEAAH